MHRKSARLWKKGLSSVPCRALSAGTSFLQKLSAVCETIPADLGAVVDGAPLTSAGIPDLSAERLQSFRACQELMSRCQLSDIIHPEALSGARYSGRWRLEKLLRENVCLDLLQSRWAGKIDFDVAAFIIPAGGVMPVHGHAGMVVSSKVLHGQLDVTSFHALAGAECSAGDLLPVEVSCERRTAADPAWFLSPAFRNIHQFAAGGGAACIVLDVLLPPYDHVRRPCEFYEAVPSTVAGARGRSGALLRPIAAPNHLLPYGVSYPGVSL